MTLTILEYAVLLRVPAIALLLLAFLPYIAFRRAPALLRGMFELTPVSTFVTALTAGMAGNAVLLTANITWTHACERIQGLRPGVDHIWGLPVESALWVVSTIACLPIVFSAVGFSRKQGVSPGAQYPAAVVGLGSAVLASWFLALHGLEMARSVVPYAAENRLFLFFAQHPALFRGYISPGGGPYHNAAWEAHLGAAIGFTATLLVYATVGIYGRAKLGKSRTVPALTAVVMLVTLLCWALAGMAFFLDPWHIPVLIPAVLWAVVTAQSPLSDHYYDLKNRKSGAVATPPQVLRYNRRPIVVAVNGGGIQAAAWSAQVLEGLDSSVPDFRRSLRMISSISGGSVGSVYYLNWLRNPDVARSPTEASVESSLDEVAWGLAWPDFLIGLLPWVFGRLFEIGRGRALEIAWRMNGARDIARESNLDAPLSGWNEATADGELPALIMNSTEVETGDRLLIGTTGIGGNMTGADARIDAAELHTIDGQPRDVGVVTGARLSATFPYVTPASRAATPHPMPHLVDGGYYDTYGMATLVEWLDQALAACRINGSIDEVLVLQIRGSKIETGSAKQKVADNRGWFYQALAPLIALINVRGAGQIAHNEIELHLLQQKWSAAGVPIHNITFEFPESSPPLSWHLTRCETAAIRSNWTTPAMQHQTNAVAAFLGGRRPAGCGCPDCNAVQ